jgi:hypothetical protein
MALRLHWLSPGILPGLRLWRTIWKSASLRIRRSDSVTCRLFAHCLALNHGEPSKAIELLQIAVPYDLGAPRSSFHGFFGTLYPVYVRGEAYLAAHQGAQAAAEFQKILDHRGIVVSDPIGAWRTCN